MSCRFCMVAGAIAGLLLILGCNAQTVQRADEIARLKSHLDTQAKALAIDPAKPLSIDRCREIALANSLDLRVRQLALRMQDDQVRLALAGALPKAAIEYGATVRSNRSLMAFEGGTSEMEDRSQRRFAAQAIVPILDFGLTYYSWQIAKDARQQERLLLVRAEQLLERDVRVAYAQHAGAIRQERMANLAYRAAQKVLQVAKSLERADMTVPADTALIEAAMAQANLDLSLATQRVQETHLVLSQLMSLPPDVRFTISDALPAILPPPTTTQLADLEDRALTVRPELAVQDLQRHISANSVRREAASFFPRLDGIGSFNWTSASQFVNKSWYVGGVAVSHSLLDGGATLWRYSIAKKAEEMEQARALLLQLGVLYDVQLRALRVRQAQDTVHAAKVLEGARKQGFNRIVNLYKEGLEDEAGAARALAELTIQATVLDRAQTDYLIAWYELEAAALPAPPATQPATRPATQPVTSKATQP